MLYLTMFNMMGGFGDYGMHGGFAGGYMGGGIGLLTMIIFWTAIIVGLVALIKWLIQESKGGAGGKSAIDILKERYAKGEISAEEFEKMKKNLQ